MTYKSPTIVKNDRIDVDVRSSNQIREATNTQRVTNVGTYRTQLNQSVKSRLVCSNTLTFSGQIKFLGPQGGANFGIPSWKQVFEDALVSAIDTFMRQVNGQTTPEGIAVEPIGFSVTYRVNLPAAVPSVFTIAK